MPTQTVQAIRMGTVVAASMFVVLAASDPHAQTSSNRYRFTTLLDSQDGLEPTRCAAINLAGTVAVQVRDTSLGINKLVTLRNAEDDPVVVAHTERVANYPTFCDNGITQITSDPSINELGSTDVHCEGDSALSAQPAYPLVAGSKRRSGMNHIAAIAA